MVVLFKTGKNLNENNINPNIKAVEYAVCGPVVLRAQQLEQEIAQGEAKNALTEVIRANMGDAHAMGQQPITFIRQLIALVAYPPLMMTLIAPSFPQDVHFRARAILNDSNGSIGCYSETGGLKVVRQHVADYIQRRDGGSTVTRPDPNNIILCAGASEGISLCLKLLSTITTDGVTQRRTGIMIPIPQYPLYSATIVEDGMQQVGYYLDEDNDWALDVMELNRAIAEARHKQNLNVRAIVIINPGNPTGQVLIRENMADIIRFAYREKLVIFADEVYQDNIYEGEFHSFKKILTEMGEPYVDAVELISFMSASKGYMGECGLRGGYFEMTNIDQKVLAHLLKSISAKHFPSVLGQVAIDCLVNPPRPGEPSYRLFIKERNQVLKSFKERALKIVRAFNAIPAIRCSPIRGAMYAFPKIEIPERAVKMAQTLNQTPDEFYIFQLLEQTGICLVPGSGFGQKSGTYHFRMTILPPDEKLDVLLSNFKKFHVNFLKQFE